MAGCEAPRHHQPGEEQCVLQAERVEEERANRLFIRHLRHRLDQASRDPERGVVVGDGLTGLRQLRSSAIASTYPRERVVAFARVLEEVAVPAGRVVQELHDRHRACSLLVGDTELRQVGANRCVEVDESLLDEPHQSQWP